MEIVKSNIDLVKLLKNGDMHAFDTIYNKYCRKLNAFVLMYLKQQEDAEEIVQEVFVRIWQNRNKIDVYASFESFLFTIAYNATMSLLRKKMSETRYREYLGSLQQINSAEQVIDQLQFEELNKKMQLLLNRLTPRQKEIYILSREEGLTHEEIAKRLDISESTVNNHLVKTLKYLKSQFDSDITASLFFFCLFLS